MHTAAERPERRAHAKETRNEHEKQEDQGQSGRHDGDRYEEVAERQERTQGP